MYHYDDFDRTLLAEGHPDSRIVVTGNTVVDALLDVASHPYEWGEGPLAALPGGRPLVFVTAHRRESFGEPLREVATAVRELAGAFPGHQFVFSLHLNPEARRPVLDLLRGPGNVSLVEALDYLSLVHLLKRTVLVLTDSGGLQEEAPGLGVPVLVLRETTERPEGVEAGVAVLVGTSRARIVAEGSRLLGDPAARAAMVGVKNPYGDGRAGERVVAGLLGTA
jgi:UDP-N-acetylglucosamine 2-epimerase